ncbi:metallophosphoesterase family protein [Deinococcus cellulosilyticus]|uniref:Phosphohydrolase n=1 Tax=Deinococcus cellulosilyticus (strain DSM 18568 / NBRC 106333 / KACC 11606 / 5516J-15) TaxID=1223518 RepID=A0A511MYN6_DEIC1|nr:metallophosphoesterase [Deinococcus cellulosilyticus]GEM45714.1 phosphohydrolase [Deinococcus cellulosilyticus NBRC 106333 = KACC 11606]
MKRILLLADHVHPFVYREGFPQGMPEVDLVLAAGDLPAYYLEFLASTLPVPVLYIPGNHRDEFTLNDQHELVPPGGVENVHGRVVEVAGLTIAGWGGVPRYRESDHGHYTPWQAKVGMWRLGMQMKMKRIRKLDIFLTHAPPLGEHAGSDYAHRGCPDLTHFMHQHQPRYMVHGHIHEYEGKKIQYQDGPTQVINAYGYRILEVEDAKTIQNEALA